MKKLLITDRLKPIIEMGKNTLSATDIKIFYASSAEEVLKIHRTERVDLIMIDLDMQGMNGDDLCSIIRKDDSLKKVSFTIVCDNNKSAIERCHECGANSYLTKPVDFYDTFRNIRKFLYITKRKNFGTLLHVLIKGESDGRAFFANSHNISNSGILFDTNKVLRRGEKINCSFYLNDSQVTVEGMITRIAKETANLFSYGMQFTKITPLGQTRIEQFIQKKIKPIYILSSKQHEG